MSIKAQFPDEQSETGEFQTQENAFRDRVSADGATPYPPAAYVTLEDSSLPRSAVGVSNGLQTRVRNHFQTAEARDPRSD